MNINIRQALINDINEIIKIENNTYGKYSWSIDAFKKELESSYSYYLVIVNLDTNEIVGYIGAWIIFEEVHIVTLVISEGFRRIGLADILLYNIINFSIQSKKKWLTLEVKISNNAAIQLYEKWKFKQLGIRKNYYKESNEDALILWSEDIQSVNFREFFRGLGDRFVLKSVTDKYQ